MGVGVRGRQAEVMREKNGIKNKIGKEWDINLL